MVSRAAIGLALCLAAAAQVPEAWPAFDVASVKTDRDPPDYIETGTARHGTLVFHNASLKLLIRYAYGLTNTGQISGPDWTDMPGERFDITAKAPADTSPDSLMPMLRRLLAERFHLALHEESRAVEHLDLETAKGGLKLTPSAEEPAAPKYVFGRGLLEYPHETMDGIAMLLSLQLKLPVLNRTAASGFFDLKLRWQPEDPNAAAAPLAGDTRPELSEALAQVGLRLTRSKSPIPVFVIDHAGRVPAGN